jgi:hypothetical protein
MNLRVLGSRIAVACLSANNSIEDVLAAYRLLIVEQFAGICSCQGVWSLE